MIEWLTALVLFAILIFWIPLLAFSLWFFIRGLYEIVQGWRMGETKRNSYLKFGLSTAVILFLLTYFWYFTN